MEIRRLRSIFFIIPGFISFGIGIAALVLPVLPGLPFFLSHLTVLRKVLNGLKIGLKGQKHMKDSLLPFVKKKG
ncbi:hypothetical protein [Amphibacillus indicireducens]|uniref:hypothetical protein n=1 Tax=Amphibacillus indicireducens TaxID=1076330 RepID=UPI0031E9BE03